MKALNMTYEYHELKGAGHGIPATELEDIFKFFNKHPRVDR
jgi:hypothetical protein